MACLVGFCFEALQVGQRPLQQVKLEIKGPVWLYASWKHCRLRNAVPMWFSRGAHGSDCASLSLSPPSCRPTIITRAVLNSNTHKVSRLQYFVRQPRLTEDSLGGQQVCSQTRLQLLGF